MHVRNLGHTLPYKSAAKNPLFRRLRNLTATLTAYITAYIFGMKHDKDSWASALETRRGLLYHVKTT